MTSFSYTVPLDLRMYDFLIESIRLKDFNEGNLFVQRFLEGGQDSWEDTQRKILALPDLWDVVECPDAQLQYLKNIVGWTSDLDRITAGLDAAALRRLISVSTSIWKNRSTESSIIDVLNLLVPTRARIWNWFNLRWVMDGTILTEQHQGRDAWMIDMPLPVGTGEYWSNVRIVDNPVGTVDKTLTKEVLNLMRPSGERFNIVYLKFLDLFEIDDDQAQWGTEVGDGPTVEEGQLKLEDDTQDEAVFADVEGSTAWSNYIVFGRVKTVGSQVFGAAAISFYGDGTGLNTYYAGLSPGTGTNGYLFVGKIVSGGSPVTLDFVDFATLGLTIQEDVWYGLRIQITPEGATNRIKIYVDGTERINFTDATFSQGTVGCLHNSPGIKGYFDEVEVMGLPVDSETVEINY